MNSIPVCVSDLRVINCFVQCIILMPRLTEAEGYQASGMLDKSGLIKFMVLNTALGPCKHLRARFNQTQNVLKYDQKNVIRDLSGTLWSKICYPSLKPIRPLQRPNPLVHFP